MNKNVILLSLLFFIFFASSCFEKKHAKIIVDQTNFIDSSSALIVINLIDIGEENISEIGICWSTNTNPTINDDTLSSTIIKGLGNASFTITNLEKNEQYYIKAFVKEGENYNYSEEHNFVFQNIFPVVKILDFDTSQYYFAVVGELISDNGSTVTDLGFCIGTDKNPSLDNCLHFTEEYPTVGYYYSIFEGLSPNTTFNVRAYATNGNGTSYSKNHEIKTLPYGQVTDFDGNEYPTVKIGNQEWMAENLKTTHYANGTSIPVVTNNNNWQDLSNTDKACCYYNNNSNNDYGMLYNWSAASDNNSSGANPSGVQGVCPNGWHLPSSAEWSELKTFVADFGYEMKEALPLKSKSGWNNDGNGTDYFGFTALPAGYRDKTFGTFYDLSEAAHFWTASSYDYNSNYEISFNDNIDNITTIYSSTNNGYSVRCVKD